jgi:hypothetical protein
MRNLTLRSTSLLITCGTSTEENRSQYNLRLASGIRTTNLLVPNQTTLANASDYTVNI